MPRMGKLTIAILSVPCCDMVTKTSWNMKHLMCFVPEEPNIKVLLPSKIDFIDFQMITEDSSNSLPVTITNENSIDIPVLLYISQVNYINQFSHQTKKKVVHFSQNHSISNL